MKKSRSSTFAGFVLVQLVTVGAFAAAWTTLTPDQNDQILEVVTGKPHFRPVKIERSEPLAVTPLYDDPEVVSDDELAAVLKQVQPRFSADHLKPNHVEHALRTWHVDAEFQDPAVMSGVEMRDFLLDHGRFLLSWSAEVEPLLQDRDTGVYIRWGKVAGASVHHDHTLACLTEAGVPLDFPVRTPKYPNRTFKDVLEQAIYDFDLDERETEWSAMAFGLWLPPVREWENAHQRKLSFDLIAKRQLRGAMTYGVCGGTHRLYSLMLLVRIDDLMRAESESRYGILSDEIRAEVIEHLGKVRDILEETQFEDGHWPYNWPEGKVAVEHPDTESPAYRDVIATGHHLEWLAIAPESLHPPRAMIHKAANWIIANTTSKAQKELLDDYTFYSHVGNALALWRNTNASAFWKKWEAEHPWQPEAPADSDSAE
ncbi:hypothetical protein GC176_13215 [bacterium]|nr:hypothetical protein [bacterium]